MDNSLIHLDILSEEERAAVDKFKEFGCTVLIGFGSKATWSDMVHSASYSEEGLKKTIAALRAKVNSQEDLEEEDLGQFAKADNVEFTVDGILGKVSFTTKEVLLVVRSAFKVRKNVSQIMADKKEIEELELQITKLEKKVIKPEQRLEMLRAQLASKKGQPVVKAEEPKQEVVEA